MRLMPLLLVVFLFSCSNTIYVVRHAEKAQAVTGASPMVAADPPLSEAGHLRAIQLREKLKSQNIQYIFSTNFKRTISTARPLNELRGSTHIELYSAKNDSTDYFIAQLKTIKKGNVLVVGHSNTVDDLCNKLCGKMVIAADLKDTQYDNLFVIRRKGKRYSFSNKKYGNLTE